VTFYYANVEHAPIYKIKNKNKPERTPLMKISRQRRSFQATAMAAWARRGRGVVGCGAAGAIY